MTHTPHLRCLIIIPQCGVCVKGVAEKNQRKIFRALSLRGVQSDNALAHHGGGDLLKAGDVGTGNQVALHAVLFGGGGGSLVDVDHDVVQALIDLLEGPGQAQAVLAHLQTGGGNTARVGSLGGGKQDAVALQVGDGLGGGRHIGTLGYAVAAIGNQSLGTVQTQLVLGGAGQGDVAGDGPDALAALDILGGGDILQIGLDAGALDLFDLLDDLIVNAVLVHNVAVGVRHGNDLAAQLGGLLVGVGGHIAGAGDHNALALKALAGVSQHLLGKVAQAVAGSLGTGERAAEGDALAGQHAGVLILQALVLAEQIADLAAADADVTGGHIGIGADMTVQLGHKALAETHDLGIRLAVGVKVSAAFAAAHGQAGQAVLEALLKAEELQDRQVDGGVEAQTALVGADGRVELHTVAAVDLYLTGIVHPRHAEQNHALGLDQALNQTGLLILRMSRNNGLQALKDFLNRLQKLLLLGVALCKALIYTLQISILNCHRKTLLYINSNTGFMLAP